MQSPFLWHLQTGQPPATTFQRGKPKAEEKYSKSPCTDTKAPAKPPANSHPALAWSALPGRYLPRFSGVGVAKENGAESYIFFQRQVGVAKNFLVQK